jgi:hypothetical protein
MDRGGLLISERIKEATVMCPRENPLYEKISNFGIALYVLGFSDGADLMSFEDVKQEGAAAVLKEHFTQIDPEELPHPYHIAESKDKYLLVIGDPDFPEHFAVLADTSSHRPYFSKLRYFGSGFDSVEELMRDFLGEAGLDYGDIRYFKKKPISFSHKGAMTRSS